MTKLTLKKSAEGKHEAFDPDGNQVGTVDHDHLCAYAKNNLSADDIGMSVAASDTERLSRTAVETFAREIGVEGKPKDEVRGLIELALHPPKAEVTLLSECVNAEGRLDEGKLNILDDSGKIARSGYRRAQDAMNRVERAYQKGQITPAMLITGAPLRLALTDGAAFRALIEDRPSLVKPNTTVGMGGSGAECQESPRVLFARLVESKKADLMSKDARMGELEAHRQANALVAKENPELLKNYRADAQGPAGA
jgi:hypothetical protein